MTLRDVTVYSLLFTASGKSLLDIIGTGVDNVELALTAQGRCDGAVRGCERVRRGGG